MSGPVPVLVRRVEMGSGESPLFPFSPSIVVSQPKDMLLLLSTPEGEWVSSLGYLDPKYLLRPWHLWGPIILTDLQSQIHTPTCLLRLSH